MNPKRNLLLLLLFLLTGYCTMLATEYETGKTYHGFKLVEKRFVKEVDAECYYFKHEKSGAHLFKIASDDPNKTFAISFKTNPESDAGTPHIMEHSVLTGSKKFPVKSPFDVLSKNSLNTFINAFTGDHLTAYPAASKNEKDYFNLMNVYFDAVFHPLIYSDPRILMQEGWHYDLTAEDAPVEYKGIVYNEMKGAYSSPTRELSYQVQKNLYPNTNYQYSSGGYPPSIPNLKYDYFLDYHRKYYHPSNSYILLYGDEDLDKELTFIDKEYLSAYDNTNVKVDFPIQTPFKEMKKVSGFYSTTEGADIKDQTFLTLNFVTGMNYDQKLALALDVIADVLVNQEAGPVRLALEEAGIGKDYSAYSDDLQQVLFQFRAQNANSEQINKFYEIVMSTLKNVVKTGLDKEAVEGTLNRKEFDLREGDDAQKGLSYGFQILDGWFFADDPFLGLEYEKPLAELKEEIKSGYLEEVIQKYFIDNTHALLLDLQPKPGLEKEINAKAEKELAEYKASLSDEDIKALVKQTNDLVEYQKEEDSPEALAKMPQLELKDINPKAEWYEVEKSEVSGVTVLHHDKFTNNVVYTRSMFDMRVLPQELLPYSRLLAEVLGSMNTENYTYGDLDKALNMHTGGFNVFLGRYLENLDGDKLIPKFIVETKAMNTKLDKLFELVTEIVTKTRYADNDRLKAVLLRHQAQLDSDIKNNGLRYALKRMESYYSKSGMFNELTSGSEYYWFITDLTNNYDTQFEEIISKLTEVAKLLFNKNNLIISVTGSKNDIPSFNKELPNYLNSLPMAEANYIDWKFDYVKKNEGLQTASKVQYALMGYDFKKLGYEYSGKMLVLNKIISRDWLYNRLRVVGGAYGGFSNFATSGAVYFGSYRDPNLKETIETYRSTPQFVKEFTASETDMVGYILSSIGDLDNPLTPSQQGNVALNNYFQKSTKEDAQKERDEVISTTLQDIKNYSKLISDIVAQDNFCIYGSEEKIDANKELFGQLIKLVRKQ